MSVIVEVSDIVFNAAVLCYQNSDALKDALKWFPDRPNYTGLFFLNWSPPKSFNYENHIEVLRHLDFFDHEEASLGL